MEKIIIDEFKKNGIEVDKIDTVSNSYSSNVYIVSSKDKKYVFKILFNELKKDNESTYLEYLSKHISVPSLVFNGSIDGKFYNVIEFVEGNNYRDDEAGKLSDEQIFELGRILGRLHSIKPINIKHNSWIDYLISYTEKSNLSLKDRFKLNSKIYEYLLEEIKKLEGKYEDVILHLDYRIGNVIFGEKNYLIDFESTKNGDYAFDFLKIYRLLPKDKFETFLDGYKSIRKVTDDLFDKLEFYNIFDAYTSLNWCIERNRTDSKFFIESKKILEKKFKC